MVLARYLGPDSYGTWTYALAAYGLALGASSLGLETLVASRIGRDRSKGAAVIGSTATLRLSLCALAIAGLAAFAAIAEGPGEVRTALLVAIPALLGRGIAMLTQSFFVAYEAVSAQIRVSFTLRLTEVVIGSLYLFLGGGVIGVIAIHAASWTIEAIWSVFQMRCLPVVGRVRPDRAMLAPLLKEGAQLGLATACAAWLLSGPIIQLRHLSGDLAITGQIALVLQVAAILVAVAQAMMFAALPVLSKAAADGDARVARYGPYVALIAVGMAVPGGLIGLAIGPWVIDLLIGEAYEMVGNLIGPAVFLAGAMAAPMGYAQAAVVNGRFRSLVVAGILGAGTMSALLPMLLHAFGPVGALLAATLGWGVRALVLIAAGVIFASSSRREI